MKEFEAIYNENFKRVFSFVNKLCGDGDLAEELTQETFFQAFKSFYRFRGECEISTWLTAIAKHTYYQYLRKNKLGPDAISLDYLAETYCANTLCSPEDELVKKSVSEATRRIVGSIPEKYRDVVMLRIYGEVPFSQIAKVLNISESSAKVIFFRAKKILMEEMRNEFKM